MLGVRTIAGRCDKMRRPFREPYDGANQAYARIAPEVGFEPTTNRLTADRSTTELLRNREPFREIANRRVVKAGGGEFPANVSRLRIFPLA